MNSSTIAFSIHASVDQFTRAKGNLGDFEAKATPPPPLKSYASRRTIIVWGKKTFRKLDQVSSFYCSFPVPYSKARIGIMSVGVLGE